MGLTTKILASSSLKDDITLVNLSEDANGAKGQSGRAILKGASWATVSEVLQIGAGLVSSIVLSRLLGTAGVAIIGSGLALHRLVHPLLNLGSAQLSVRAVSFGQPLQKVSAFLLTGAVVGAAVGTGLLTLLAWLFPLGVGVGVMAALGFSEGLALHTTGALVAFCEAAKQPALGTAVKASSAATRLCVVGGAVVVGTDTVEAWVVWLAIGGLLSTLSAVVIVGLGLGVRYGTRFWNRGDASVGFLLATNTSAQTLLSDVDKALLNGMGQSEASGQYVVAYRVVSLAYVPVTALARTQLAQFFELGKSERSAAVRLARRLSVFGGAFGVFAGAVLLITAGLIPVVWGENFEEAAVVARWLCWLPLLKSLQYFWANLLTGLDRQRTRLLVLISAGFLNLMLNLALIPSYGWHGAVAATAGSETLYLCLLWGSARHELMKSSEWHRSHGSV